MTRHATRVHARLILVILCCTLHMKLTLILRWDRPCMVVQPQQIDIHYFVTDFVTDYCYISIQSYSLLVVLEGHFMQNFPFASTLYATLLKNQQKELHRFNCVCGFIGKSAVIKYQLLLKVILTGNCVLPFSNSFLLYASLKRPHCLRYPLLSRIRIKLYRWNYYCLIV